MNKTNWRDTAELVGMAAIVAGLILVAYELRQNSDLMRAQISMDRAAVSVEALTAVANEGEIARILAKLRSEVDGYPFAFGMVDVLTPEEYERFRVFIIARSNEFSNDWYQCAQGLVDEELCQREIVSRVRNNMVRFYEVGIDYSYWPLEAVRALQPFTSEYGLPELADDGSWIE